MKNALIIDDVEVSRYALSTVLEEIGFTCVEASDKDSAEQALNNPVNVIFLDWHLKKDSGLKLIKDLKAFAPSTPVIVISGVEGKEKAQKALQHGADAFVEKPANADTIQAALQNTRII